MKELKAIRESRQKPFIEEAAKFNQESIAAALGVTVQTYRAYEKDPSQMKLPTAVMLLSLIHISRGTTHRPSSTAGSSSSRPTVERRGSMRM